jgi:hypothetical protein
MQNFRSKSHWTPPPVFQGDSLNLFNSNKNCANSHKKCLNSHFVDLDFEFSGEVYEDFEFSRFRIFRGDCDVRTTAIYQYKTRFPYNHLFQTVCLAVVLTSPSYIRKLSIRDLTILGRQRDDDGQNKLLQINGSKDTSLYIINRMNLKLIQS